MTDYKHTHVSYFDASPAMLVRERKGMVRMMNECGETWSDPAAWWIPIGSETPEDYERWDADTDREFDDWGYPQSMESAYSDYVNSDSNIAYLNRN